MSEAEFIEVLGRSDKLTGTVTVQGAKNAALPQLIATLLTEDECEINNVPNLEDVTLILQLLQSLGSEPLVTKDFIRLKTPSIKQTSASYSLIKSLRASFWVLAPLLARVGRAEVALPGGDIIGARPVDIHLEALGAMGASIQVKHGVVYAEAPNGLKPATIFFRFPSVGATHQILMAASLVRGTTILHGGAREPEVVALCEMLQGMGVGIHGAGSNTIVIEGRDKLSGVKSTLIGDRIVAGTYLAVGALGGGPVIVNGVKPEYLDRFLQVLREMGATVEVGDNSVSVSAKERLTGVQVATGPFPALATDLQAILLVLMCTAKGESFLAEHVFEGRFGIVSDLSRMGAKITVREQSAIINGVPRLTGAEVAGHDLRASAALVIAGLLAEGTAQIFEIRHLRRGYENFVENLTALGGTLSVRSVEQEAFRFTGC
jgi:UDP-N-acetylglucosamine 1-carboxyvinyltransferase